MFEAAVVKFVKSVGPEDLIPVPSLDEADRCRPLNVVVKKNRKWFWEKPKYEPTSIMLHEILHPPLPFKDDEIKQNTRKLLTYQQTHKFSLHGDIGAKLKAVFEFDLKGSDSMDVAANFGDIEKAEVELPEMIYPIQNRRLDMNHEFVTQVQESGKKVLCVVVGSAYTVSDSTITCKVNWSTSEDIEGQKLPKPIDVAGGDESSGISAADTQVFKIPKNTPLAYSVFELLVSPEGNMEVMIEEECKGGFSTDKTVVGHQISDDIEKCFQVLCQLSAGDREKLQTAVSKMAAFPKDVTALRLLMKDARRAPSSGSSKTIDVEELQALFVSGQDAWEPILLLAGFTTKDNAFAFPKQSPLLNAFKYLADALVELSEESLLAVRSIDTENARPVFQLITEVRKGKEGCSQDDGLALLEKSGEGKEFLRSLGIKKNDDDNLCRGEATRYELSAARGVIYALWLETTHQKSPSKRSCILI